MCKTTQRRKKEREKKKKCGKRILLQQANHVFIKEIAKPQKCTQLHITDHQLG